MVSSLLRGSWNSLTPLPLPQLMLSLTLGWKLRNTLSFGFEIGSHISHHTDAEMTGVFNHSQFMCNWGPNAGPHTR